MNYIYLGISDLYLPATVAAIHLGILNETRRPRLRELKMIRHFRNAEKEDDGKLFPAGEDQAGDKVYVACVKAHPEVFHRGIQSLLGIYQISQQEFQVIPCLPENQEVSTLLKALKTAGLPQLTDIVAYRLVKNRFADLHKISAKTVTA